MTSYVPIVKNGASGAIFYVSLAPRTANGQWQSNPTLAAGDVKVSLDGGSLANLNTLPAVTPASSKLVKVTLSQAETNADNIAIIFSDAAGAEWCDLTVNLQTAAKQFDDLASQSDVTSIKTTTDKFAFTVANQVDANVLKIGGTTQTARDIGASVLLSTGTGTGQLDFTSGVVKANLAQILGTALTETAGQIAAGFKKLFDVVSPVFTLLSINQTGDAYARIGAAGAGLTALGDTRIANLDATISSRASPTNITAGTITNLTNAPTSGDLTATMKASVTTAATAATPTIASVSGSVGSVAGNVGGNVVGSVGSVAGAVGSVTATVNADIKKVNGVTVNGDGAGTPWGP